MNVFGESRETGDKGDKGDKTGGACIEYTYNEFNCLVRIRYNVFVGGGVLAVKPPIFSSKNLTRPIQNSMIGRNIINY